MPIKPENKKKYPANWPEIRKRIRARAKYCCEFCGVAHDTIIRRGTAGDGIPVYRLIESPDYYHGLHADTGETVDDSCCDLADYGDPVRVVLTVAHLDHTPENCSDDNLKALCQRCHLVYDKDNHAKNRRETLRSRKATMDLFDDDLNAEGFVAWTC